MSKSSIQSLKSQDEPTPDGVNNENPVNDEILGEKSDQEKPTEEEADLVEVVKEEEKPYCPPPPNFVYVLDKDSNPVIVNPLCRKDVFLDFIRRRLDVDPEQTQIIDLCSMEGKLAGIRSLKSNAYVGDLVTNADSYLPCWIELDGHGGVKAIELYIADWRTRFPTFENKDEDNKDKPSAKRKK